jgi:hypothetical protein
MAAQGGGGRRRQGETGHPTYIGNNLNKTQNIEIEMTIPNMFSIDRYW